jgi:hypothetical protein
MTESIMNADEAQAVLAMHLIQHEMRDIVVLRLQIRGNRLSNGTSGIERPFYYFQVGENDGWYVNADNGSVEQDENSPQKKTVGLT